MGARRQKTTRSAAVFCRLAEQSTFPDSSRQRLSNEPLTRGNGLPVVEIGEDLSKQERSSSYLPYLAQSWADSRVTGLVLMLPTYITGRTRFLRGIRARYRAGGAGHGSATPTFPARYLGRFLTPRHTTYVPGKRLSRAFQQALGERERPAGRRVVLGSPAGPGQLDVLGPIMACFASIQA